MIDLLSTMQVVLKEADFSIRLESVGHMSLVCFEDEAIVGFGCIFDDPDSLLANWQATEASLLNHFAPNFRAAGGKAWNIYSVFLCGVSADSIQARKIRWIEEELERTRKLAACGIGSREDLIKALLPVLPLQYQPVLRAEDPAERLRGRIRTIAPKAEEAALDDSVPPAEVVRILGAS